MKTTLLILLSIFTLNLFAQTETELVDQANKSNKAKDWNELAAYYSDQRNAESQLIAADKAYNKAVEEGNKIEQGRALIYQSECELAKYKKYTDRYISLLQQAETLLKKQSPSIDLALCYHKISQIHNTKGEHNEALVYLFKAIEVCPSEETKQLGSIYCDLGYSYLYKGVPDSTKIYTLKAIDIATVNCDTMALTVGYSTLGIVSKREYDYAKALEYYLKCAKLYESQKEWSRLVVNWCNIAVLYTEWGKNEQAIEFGHKALNLCKHYDLPHETLSRASLILGAPLVAEKRYREAVNTYLQALSGLEVSYMKRSCLFGLATAYYDLGIRDSSRYYLQALEEEFSVSKAKLTDSYYSFKGYMALKENKFNEAVNYYEESLNIQKNKKSGVLIGKDISIYTNLVKAYLGLHNYKKALEYQQTAFDLQDTINQRKHKELLSEYYAEFKTAEKELEITRLEMKQQETRFRSVMIFITLAAVVILLIIALLYTRLQRLKKEREATLLAQRIEQKDNEFAQLQQQTEKRLTRKYIEGLETERERLAKELHDDVCNSIWALEMKVESLKDTMGETATNEIKTLSSIRNRVRSISHELMPPVFQYATIDEMLDDFIDHLQLPALTKASYSSTKDYDWNRVSPEVGFELYRVAQEAISNTLKYADATEIRVKLSVDDKTIVMAIEDNGKGFDIDNHKAGIGLHTIKQRINSINGKVEIYSQSQKGTKIITKTSIEL